MLTVSRRRPSWSLAWATWTSPWVSTPTVTRVGWACAMVVMAISLRAWGGRHAPAGWADSTAMSLWAQASIRSGLLGWRCEAVAAASSRQIRSRARSRWTAGVRPLPRPPETSSQWTDDLWVADSTPVECGRSRQTARRSALAGWAGYGHCASHSRYFWGLRLHLVTTVHGLPVAFALATPTADEREVLADLFDVEPGLLAARRGQRLLLDKGYRDAETEAILAARRVVVLRPAYQRETPRPAASLFKALRQCIESVNDTLKGQLDLERHGGRTIEGVTVRVLQRLLALTAAIWHNHKTGQPVIRSLVAYDHS